MEFHALSFCVLVLESPKWRYVCQVLGSAQPSSRAAPFPPEITAVEKPPPFLVRGFLDPRRINRKSSCVVLNVRELSLPTSEPKAEPDRGCYLLLCWMRLECLCEEIAAAPSSMDVTPMQRMFSACAGVLATSVVVTPMGKFPSRVYLIGNKAAHSTSLRSQCSGTSSRSASVRESFSPYVSHLRGSRVVL